MTKTVLYNERVRQFVVDRISTLPADGTICVEIRKAEENRSVAQNRLMWRWFGEFAEETGYTKHEAHDVFCREILGVDVVRSLRGELVERVKGTSGLTVAEMANFLDEVDMLSTEHGVLLTHPEDLWFKAMGYGK